MFHGCASIYSVVEFEVLEPATVSLPEHIQHLLVLNRAPFTLHAFEESDVEGMNEKQLVMVDTLVLNSLFRGLLKALQQSPNDRFHHPLWKSTRREDTTSLDDLILTRREVDALCRENGTDAILSLESYSMDLDKEVQYYSNGEMRNEYYEVSSIIRWNIYLYGSPKPFDTYTMADTLFFPQIVDGVFVEFFSTVRMIREAFYNSGMKYGRYLAPVWVHTSRNLYKGREDSLKLASKQTDLGEWDQAYGIWESLSTGIDSTLAAKALHNMAIFHELEDNLDSANLLVTSALEYDTLEAVKAYKEELDMRILNRNELYKQVR